MGIAADFRITITKREDLDVGLPDHSGQTSVLRTWVMELPLREQGTLLAGIRGCDTVRHGDYYQEYGVVWNQHPTKTIIRMLRYAIMNPADDRELGAQQGFMADWRVEKLVPREWPAKCLDNLPLHFVMHLLHAIEVVAYRHPDAGDAMFWLAVYYRIVEHLHLQPETSWTMIERLSEDRVAAGKVRV